MSNMLTIEDTVNGKRRDSVIFNGGPINLSAIGRKAGIDVSTVSRIFSRRRYPKLDQARRLAAVFDMGLDEFLKALDLYLEALDSRPR